MAKSEIRNNLRNPKIRLLQTGLHNRVLRLDVESSELMQEIDVEVILQRAREKYPDASPRIITDNGPPSLQRSAVA